MQDGTTEKKGAQEGAKGPAPGGRPVGPLPTPSARALDLAIADARRNGRRIQRIEVEAAPYWLKVARGKSWLVQVSKGSARQALMREIALMRRMHDRGAPVPDLVRHGDDHYVIRDAGRTLSALLIDTPEDPALTTCFDAAGQALARMHEGRIAHGRPYLRDICWDGATGRITFIDFERGARLDARPLRLARDVALLLMSIYALRPDSRGADLAEAFLASYFADAPTGMPAACTRFARYWMWLPVVTAPMRWHEIRFRQDRRWKEYTAVPLALAHLRRGARGVS